MWMGLAVLSFTFAIAAHTQLSLGIQASFANGMKQSRLLAVARHRPNVSPAQGASLKIDTLQISILVQLKEHQRAISTENTQESQQQHLSVKRRK